MALVPFRMNSQRELLRYVCFADQMPQITVVHNYKETSKLKYSLTIRGNVTIISSVCLYNSNRLAFEAKAAFQRALDSFPRRFTFDPTGLEQFLKERGKTGDFFLVGVYKGGGKKSALECAREPVPLVRVSMVRAQPATGLGVWRRRRQDNAAGAAGMMALSEGTTPA